MARVSVISGSLNTDVTFVLIDLLSFLIRIWIYDLTALTHSESLSNSSFLVFHPFLGIILHRVHEKFEVVFPIYGLWLSIFWTFNKDFTEIVIVYDAQLPRNDMTRGLYLNGVLWQKQSGGLALRPSMLKSCNRRL